MPRNNFWCDLPRINNFVKTSWCLTHMSDRPGRRYKRSGSQSNYALRSRNLDDDSVSASSQDGEKKRKKRKDSKKKSRSKPNGGESGSEGKSGNVKTNRTTVATMMMGLCLLCCIVLIFALWSKRVNFSRDGIGLSHVDASVASQWLMAVQRYNEAMEESPVHATVLAHACDGYDLASGDWPHVASMHSTVQAVHEASCFSHDIYGAAEGALGVWMRRKSLVASPTDAPQEPLSITLVARPDGDEDRLVDGAVALTTFLYGRGAGLPVLVLDLGNATSATDTRSAIYEHLDTFCHGAVVLVNADKAIRGVVELFHHFVNGAMSPFPNALFVFTTSVPMPPVHDFSATERTRDHLRSRWRLSSGNADYRVGAIVVRVTPVVLMCR